MQLDKSTDVSNKAKLAIMIKMVFSNFSIKEELLKLLTMQELLCLYIRHQQ